MGISRPFNDMLRKDAEVDWDNPTEEQANALENLKYALANLPILGLPKRGRPFMIDSDASQYALDAVLLLEQEELIQ